MSKLCVIGHDPGTVGALVRTLDGEVIDYLRMPMDGKRVDVKAVWSWLEESPLQPDLFISEEVWGFPGDTPTTAWQFSRTESAVDTISRLLGYTTHFVPPVKWQKAILQGMKRGSRAQIRESYVSWASEKYPPLAYALRIKKNDGIAAAACIAEYGLRLLRRGRI